MPRRTEPPHSSTRAKAAESLLPSLGAAAVWEKCEPLQFNDALISCQCEPSWFRQRKKPETQHVCTRGSVTPSITLGLHGDVDMKSWEELVNDGWSMWDWCGGCAAGTETKEKNFVTDSETAAMRTLRPNANNELGKKRTRTDIERRRTPPGLRGSQNSAEHSGDIQQDQDPWKTCAPKGQPRKLGMVLRL